MLGSLLAAGNRQQLETRRHAVQIAQGKKMSATSLVRGVYLHMADTLAKTKKSATLDEVLERFKGDPALALKKENGQPYEYNRAPATPKQRLKQALSSVRSAYSKGSKADPRWIVTCDAISERLNLGASGAVAPPVGAEMDIDEIASAI